MTPQVQIQLDRGKRQVQAWVDEKQIGEIEVVPVDFDWGRGTIVPMGGIAAVGTNQQYRRLGIGRRMMQKVAEFSREQGYPVGGVSTGYGNSARRLYSRSGCVFLFPVDYYGRPVSRPEPAPVPDDVEVRPYARGDEEGIVELWNRSYSANDFFGACPTDTSKWTAQRSKLLNADPQSVWVALRNGTLVGWAEYYFLWDEHETCAFLVDESADSPVTSRALLTRLERSLNDAGLKHFSFDVSRHETRMRNALVDVGCRRRDGHVFQVAIFDLADLLNRLQPLYLKRLRGSRLDSWPRLLRVGMGEQTAEIELPGGDAGKQVELTGPYETVVRILCGRSSAWQEYLRGYLKITGEPGRNPGVMLDTFLGQYPWFHPRRERW